MTKIVSGATQLTLIIVLNAVPVVGVLLWGWRAFDLIFIYWVENVIIGLFTVGRFLIRPYEHLIELAYLFLAAFFMFHYGMFCFVHGAFVLSLFSEDLIPAALSRDPYEAILPVIEMRGLTWAIAALVVLQIYDWIRDSLNRGFGADGIKELMIAPYRRIVVLHITIIASGLLLVALDEPLSGLLVLALLKIAFDIYHWKKDEEKIQKVGELSEDMKKKIDEVIAEPKISVNGKEIRFDSIEEMMNSKYYSLMRAIIRMVGGCKYLGAMESYVKDAAHVDKKDQKHA